jgi:hypothetical protein
MDRPSVARHLIGDEPNSLKLDVFVERTKVDRATVYGPVILE